MAADKIDETIYYLDSANQALTETITVEPESTKDSTAVTLKNVPEAEYMYGCCATAVGMLLGYYDLNGYKGYDLSDIVPGDVQLNSRGSDGNKYNMNEFNTALGKFIASEDYVTRFYGTSSAAELPYTFIDSDVSKGLNVSCFNCLADWMGTGQYWRGNDDLSTMHYVATLDWLYETNQTYTVSGKEIDVKYVDYKWGVDQYLQTLGYSLDRENTATMQVDGNGGTFTFEDYKAEIDAGRPVIVGITGHAMIGYGYDSSTNEIIFDDTYNHDCRMTWNGTYQYASSDRKLETITTIVLDEESLKRVDLSLSATAPSGWDNTLVLSHVSGSHKTTVLNSADHTYLDIAVKNIGTKASGEFSVSIYLDGTLKTTKTMSSAAASEFSMLDDIDLGVLSIGSHTVKVVADPDDELNDKDTANNTKTVSISVEMKDVESPVFTSEIAVARPGDYDVTISWSAATDNVGVAGYQIKLNDKTYTTANLNYTFKNLAPGSYDVSVKAYDKAENYSEARTTGFTITDVTAPVMGNAKAEVVKDSVTVSWSAATDNVKVDHYKVSFQGESYDTPDLEYAFSSLALGNYQVSVSAFDTAGNESAAKTVSFSVKDFTPPEFNSDITVDVEDYDAVISWDAATDDVKVTGYQVTLDGKTYTTDKLSYQFQNLSVGTYTVSVSAYDAEGNLSESRTASFKIKDVTAPQYAGGMTVDIDDYDATVNFIGWTDNVGITEYEVFCNGVKAKTAEDYYTLEDLAVGEYTVSVKAYDAAVNVSETQKLSFEIKDVTAPVFDDAVTANVKDYSVTVTWKAAKDNIAVSKYLIYMDDILQGETKDLIYNMDGVAAGSHTVTVKACDEAGNMSDPNTASFEIKDITPPEFENTVTCNVSDYDVILRWDEASDNVGVAGYQIDYEGKTYDTANLSYILEDAEIGKHTATVSAYDAAGNKSEAHTVSFEVKDVTPPEFGKITVDVVEDDVTISWEAATDYDPDVSYQLCLNGTAYTTTKNLGYTYNDLALGKYTVAVCAIDHAGNISKVQSAEFEVKDFTAPVMTGIKVEHKDYNADISWDAATDDVGVAGYRVTINKEVFTTTETSYHLTDMKPGTYNISVEAFDAAGNVSIKQFAEPFEVKDTTAPDFGKISADVFEHDATISWDAAEDNDEIAGYEIKFYDKTYYTTDLSYTIKGLPFGDNPYKVSVRAYDRAGNYSASQETEFEIKDFTPPVLGPISLKAVDDKAIVSWDAAKDNEDKVAGYQVCVDGEEHGTTKELSYELSGLRYGLRKITVRAYDEAGNYSNEQLIVYNVDKDTLPPDFTSEITAEVNAYDVLVSWEAATDDVGVTEYQITLGEATYTTGDLSYTLHFGNDKDSLGEYTVSVKALDAAGNISEAQNTVFEIKDVTAPEYAKDITAEVNDYDVTLNLGSWTDNVEVVKYQITVGENTYTAEESTFTIKELSVGKYTVSVKALDAAGNESKAQELTFEVKDVTAPKYAKAITAKVKGYDVTLNLNGWTDNVGIVKYQIAIGENTYTSEESTYTMKELSVGTYTVSVKALDAAGYESEAQELTFEIEDVTSPVFESEIRTSVNVHEVTVSWDKATDNVGIAKYRIICDGEVYETEERNYLLAFDEQAAGKYTVSVKALDAAGNVSDTGKAVFELADIAAPVFEEAYADITGGNAELVWQAADNVAVTGYRVDFKGETYEFEPDTTFFNIENLGIGTYKAVITAFDEAGNISEKEVSFAVVDNIAPIMGSVSASVVDDSAVLTWKEAKDNIKAVKYEIYIDGSYEGETESLNYKFLHLEKGDYEASVAAVDKAGNVSKAQEVKFSISKTEDLKENWEDNWTDLAFAGADGHVGDFGSFEIGASYSDEIGREDPVDYLAFTVEDLAKVSFTIDTENTAKFSINQLVEETDNKGYVTYSLKALQNATVTGGKTTDSKELMLEKGTYYIGMQKATAKADAEYTLTVNEKSCFFTEGDNSDDWTDMKTAGASSEEYYDIGILDDSFSMENWVGYGDAVDYSAFTLESAAKLSFDLSSTDDVKFSICQLISQTDRKGNVTYSLKTLQNTSLDVDKKTKTTTDGLQLDAGTYYMAVESTNAKKGGNAYYSIGLNEDAKFYPGKNEDQFADTWKSAAAGDSVSLDEVVQDWVGYSDSADFIKFELEESGKISIDLQDEETVSALKNKEIRLTCVNAKGRNVVLTSLKNDEESIASKRNLSAGTYYLGVTCTNTKKYDTEYSLSIGMASGH